METNKKPIDERLEYYKHTFLQCVNCFKIMRAKTKKERNPVCPWCHGTMGPYKHVKKCPRCGNYHLNRDYDKTKEGHLLREYCSCGFNKVKQ